MSRLIVRFVCLVGIFVNVIVANPSCPELQPGMTNVHLVCHTHDDVGWLKTVDQYYYGARKNITWVGVQYILDSVVDALLRDSKRKFIFVESAFFFRWWKEQDETVKRKVKRLVADGQLEFTSGGWCMNDEAAAHYTAIIDQMSLGLAKLNTTFGPIAFPRVSWQIDPFGHSKEQASLFAQMGMDGLFFGRLDYDDKRTRWETKKMEMVWKGSQSLGKDSWLFTGVLPNGYSPPKGFCFDLLCPDDPIMDDPALEGYNKDQMVDMFLAEVETQKSGYATNNLIMTMGEDFNYVYAESWYKNLDKLIRYVNERQINGSKVNVFYSTPSCYLDALHKSQIRWPTKSDDFFPYASDPHAFWTGYFTSRPTLKGYIRQANSLLQAVKQMAALSGMARGPGVEVLAEAVAVAQHHDAVTGTAKQHVTDDYSKRLSEGVEAARPVLDEGFGLLTQPKNALPSVHSFHFCPLLNISSCAPSESKRAFVVNVYNPLARTKNHYVRVPVRQPVQYDVTDDEGKVVETQLVAVPSAVLRLPGRSSPAKFDLVFLAEGIPALGVRQFHVSATDKLVKLRSARVSSLHDTTIVKGNVSITLDATSKKLKSLSVLNSDGVRQNIEVSQEWMWYKGMVGNNAKPNLRASGAYIFRPEGEAKPFEGGVMLTAFYDGPLVGEFHQEWNPWVTQVLRLYKGESFVEVEWLVGPIPVEDGIGKEVVNRIQWTEMATNNTFYTDANGREMQKRTKNHRSTWKLNSTEPVSQNYYPVTSRLILSSTDSEKKAALLTDRSQGGTSLSDGAMEAMVHRRLLHDDAFGVGEPLSETAFGTGLVARGKHLLLHSAFETETCDFGCLQRSLGEELFMQPIVTFSSPASFQVESNKTLKSSVLSKPLPRNIRILTLEPWTDGSILLRLENYYEAGESSLSETSYVEVESLFRNWLVTDIKEVTLGANKYKEDLIRLSWNTTNDLDDVEDLPTGSAKANVSPKGYAFSPMQIRTFILVLREM